MSPAQYESAGKRRDGSISREGSVELRPALTAGPSPGVR
ncbi:MAG: transposase [Nocardioides sp.]